MIIEKASRMLEISPGLGPIIGYEFFLQLNTCRKSIVFWLKETQIWAQIVAAARLWVFRFVRHVTEKYERIYVSVDSSKCCLILYDLWDFSNFPANLTRFSQKPIFNP